MRQPYAWCKKMSIFPQNKNVEKVYYLRSGAYRATIVAIRRNTVDQSIERMHSGLPHIPGWVALTHADQEQLQQLTSDVLSLHVTEGLAALSACRKLCQIEAFLDGKKMTISNYINTVYGGSASTAWRRLASFKKLREIWPDHLIDSVATKGAMLLRGATGIGVKELMSVAKELPPPNSKDEKVIEGFITGKVRKKIAERRSKRSKLSLDADDAAKIAANFTISMIRKAKLETSAEKRKWLAKKDGWVMEAEAIHGTLTAVRAPLPEGVPLRRGRPRNLHPQGENAA